MKIKCLECSNQAWKPGDVIEVTPIYKSGKFTAYRTGDKPPYFIIGLDDNLEVHSETTSMVWEEVK